MMLEMDMPAAILLIVVCILFLLWTMILLVGFINEFSGELDYLNTEIARTTGAERKYWQRKKRRLWLSILPFCRK